MKIGIIGYGFVGSAQATAFARTTNSFMVNDPKLGSSSVPLEEIVGQCEAVFICVPTPITKNEDAIDGSILRAVVEQLATIVAVRCARGLKMPLFIIKSTVPPDYVAWIRNKLRFNVCYVPEFLREKHAQYDVIHPNMLIIGCDDRTLGRKVERLHTEHSLIALDGIRILHVGLREASLVKYGINSFLASKVIWMNQYSALVNKMGLRWDDVMRGMAADPRVGTSHMEVPGHDGKHGYGGTCFPKDVAAVLAMGAAHGVALSVLAMVDDENRDLRPEEYR